VFAPLTTKPSTPEALNASSHSRASATSAVTDDNCSGGRHASARRVPAGPAPRVRAIGCPWHQYHSLPPGHDKRQAAADAVLPPSVLDSALDRERVIVGVEEIDLSPNANHGTPQVTQPTTATPDPTTQHEPAVDLATRVRQRRPALGLSRASRPAGRSQHRGDTGSRAARAASSPPAWAGVHWSRCGRATSKWATVSSLSRR
jgi:hypothetical protein